MSDDEVLDLFDVDAPRIHTPRPSAPGSETSALAAERVTDPMRQNAMRSIMLYLASQKAPVSRESICGAVGMRESTACARLADLRPTYIRAVPSACLTSAKRSCDGYELTDAGRARVRTTPCIECGAPTTERLCPRCYVENKF